MRSFIKWFGSLTRKPQASSRRRSVPLSVEALEARVVPTVVFQPRFGAETLAAGHTGPALSGSPVYLIFEGSYWQSPTGITKQDVINTVNNILGSSYVSHLTQYGSTETVYLPGGSPQGAFLSGTLTDTSMYSTFDPLTGTSSFVRDDLAAAARRNMLNRNDPESGRSIYYVITPPGMNNATNGGGGFHNELTFNYTYGGVQYPEQVPFGWVGSFGSTRAAQVDTFSGNFSHEFVETLTDPYIYSHDANRIVPGASWDSGQDKLDEIADFEPDNLRYTYRLGNGAVVQAYWDNAANVKAYVVPDGTAQTFSLSPRYARNPITGVLYQDSFYGNFDLTVNGDQLANKNDMITIQTITSGVQTGGVRITLNGEVVTFDAGKIHSISVNTGAGTDTVNVESLPADVALAVNLGSGTDTVNFSPAAGQLDNLLGPVNIYGGTGTSTVNVNDWGTADASFLGGFSNIQHTVTYVIQGGELTRNDSVMQGSFLAGYSTSSFQSDITFSGISHVTVFGGKCANTFDVQTAGLTTPLSIYGGAADMVAFDDSANADDVSTTYTLENNLITRVGVDYAAGGGLLSHTASVDYHYIPTVYVDGATSSAEEFDVHGIVGGTDVSLIPGPGQNTFYVGDDTTRLDSILGGLHIYGQGTNTLVLNDRAMQYDPYFVDAIAYDIAGTPYGGNVVRTHTQTFTDAFGPLTYTSTQTITFTGVQSLLVEGGSTGNTFHLLSTPPGTDLSLDGGAGVNTLDYSAYTGDVVVDLPVGTATGFAVITNIQNITGSIGNDILVGDGNANVLVGGTGRNLLIGGTGADQIIGGGDDNILIAGSTAYDTNTDALAAVMSEWTRTDLPYADRVGHLLGGDGLNGDSLLNAASYIPDDGGNSLTGASAQTLDLFFGSLAQDANDWDPNLGEIFINPAQAITFDALADSTYGDAPITLNATSSSGLPVSYQVLSGPATITDNILTITGAGIVTLEASQAGDGAYAAATPIDQSFTVNQAHLTVVADNQARLYGQADSVFTATITGFVNGETLADSGVSGAAAFISNDTASSPVGTYPITALQGTLAAANYDFTNFVDGTLNVNKAAATASLQTSVSSAAAGQQITFTAKVTAVSPATSIPGGTVTFKDGSTVLGTGTLSNGVATFKTANLAVGSHAIAAVYSGDGNFTGNTSASLTQTVKQAATTVALSSSAGTAVVGQSITLTAKISVVAPGAGVPTGTVTFKDGSTVLGTATLSNGVSTFQTAKLTVGSHAITVVYAGNSSFTTSTSAALTETINRAATTTTLTSSASNALFGQSITLTANIGVVAPGAALPTGTVTFKDGSTVLATVTLSNGLAVFQTTKLSKGKHSLTVVYNGDVNLMGSTSTVLTETIN